MSPAGSLGSSTGDPATGSKTTQRCNTGENNACLLCSTVDFARLLEESRGADVPGNDEFCDPLKWKQDSDRILPAFCHSVKCQK